MTPLTLALTCVARCTSGCVVVAGSNVVSIADRKVFGYECTGNCSTFFGGLSQTWSLYRYSDPDTDVIGPDELIAGDGEVIEGLLLTSKYAATTAAGLGGGW